MNTKTLEEINKEKLLYDVGADIINSVKDQGESLMHKRKKNSLGLVIPCQEKIFPHRNREYIIKRVTEQVNKAQEMYPADGFLFAFDIEKLPEDYQ